MKRTSFKRGFVTLLILALLMLYVPVASFALTGTYQYSDVDDILGIPVFMEGSIAAETVLFTLESTEGVESSLAYCADFSLLMYPITDFDYQVAFLEDANYIGNSGRVRNVILNSYPNMTLGALQALPDLGTLTLEEAIAASQAALWSIIHNVDYINAFNFDSNTDYENTNIDSYYTYLVGLSAISKPATATINLIDDGSIVGSDVLIEFEYMSDGVDLESFDDPSFTVVESAGSAPGYTKVSITIPTSTFTVESDLTFTINIEGTQTLMDVYVFEPIEGSGISGVLVSEGFENTTSINEELSIDLTGVVTLPGGPTDPTTEPTDPPVTPTDPTDPPVNPTNPPVQPAADPEPSGPQGTVSVHHEDTDGNNLASVFEFSGTVGTNYGTSARTFDGYELVSTPDNASGAFIDGDIDVVYVYSDGEAIETEPVPLAPPAVPEDTDAAEDEVIEDEATEDEVVEEPMDEIVLDEEVPLADALPQTGQIPAEIFFGIGSVLSLLGISLKKKK